MNRNFKRGFQYAKAEFPLTKFRDKEGKVIELIGNKRKNLKKQKAKDLIQKLLRESPERVK